MTALITKETTVGELAEMLSGRGITGLRLSLGARRYAQPTGERTVDPVVESGSCVSERDWSTHRSRTAHNTLIGALSALLSKIPEVSP